MSEPGAGRLLIIAKIAVFALATCDPALARLFTPLHPQLGRYEVCADARPIGAVARNGWAIEEAEPLDAFGRAGSYDRAALARLYGGRRVQVARGWYEEEGRFVSETLISPYPDASLSHLETGTLVIRWTLDQPRNHESTKVRFQ